MRESTAKNIKFESIEDLFGTPREFDENTISIVPLKNLYTFENHPYRVLDKGKWRFRACYCPPESLGRI